MKRTEIPAFPVLEGTTQWIGMTLRDYFAAKAMQSLLQIDLGSYETEVQRAYEIADMMIKEREK